MFLKLRKYCLGKGFDGVEAEDHLRDFLPRVLPMMLPKIRFLALQPRIMTYLLENMEPAIRIERTTCGLRISDSPTSDNVSPQETTIAIAPDMAADRVSLSCPGSSVVAEGARFDNPESLETIDHDLLSLVRSQSPTGESEIGEEPIKYDRTR